MANWLCPLAPAAATLQSWLWSLRAMRAAASALGGIVRVAADGLPPTVAGRPGMTTHGASITAKGVELATAEVCAEATLATIAEAVAESVSSRRAKRL